HPIACVEWQADLAAWLAADIAPEREAALMAHLSGCDACRTEADSLQGVAAALLTALPDDADPVQDASGAVPPEDLEDRILRRVAAERRRPRRLVLVAALGMAAAAIVAVVVVAAAVDRS